MLLRTYVHAKSDFLNSYGLVRRVITSMYISMTIITKHNLTGKFEMLGKMSKRISGEDFMTYMYGKFGSNAKDIFRETTCVPQ